MLLVAVYWREPAMRWIGTLFGASRSAAHRVHTLNVLLALAPVRAPPRADRHG
jgi:hypothetical protein